MNNVTVLPNKQTFLILDGHKVDYETINRLFHDGELKFSEMALLFKKRPHFHHWFIQRHRQVWV